MKSSRQLGYEFFALTDTGRVRSNNEDAVAIHEAARLVLLADGMGGYSAGEVAADMAVNLVGSELAQWLEDAPERVSMAAVRQAMLVCVENANQAILGAALANPQYLGMGTTLVAVRLQGEALELAWVGDSRAYRVGSTGIEQLSQVLTDHDSRAHLTQATAAVLEDQHYQALKSLRALLPREERLLAAGSA